jgi:hypothetical protein
VADAEEVLVHLDGIADVVDVAEMDRIMRVEVFDPVGDARGLVCPRSPVAGERDAHAPLVAFEPVDAGVRLTFDIAREGMASPDPVAHILAEPFPDPRWQIVPGRRRAP